MSGHRLRRLAVSSCLCVALAIAMALNGCGHSSRILHGERFSSDGTVLLLAARLPSCGCITLGNATGGLPEAQRKTLRVKARLYGEVIGELKLEPNKTARVRFDWAGLQTGNAYQLAVYDNAEVEAAEKGKGADPDALRPIWDYLYVDQRSVVESSCREQACPFGDLAMNQAFNAMISQGDLDVRRRGVNFTSGGLQLEVAARFADPSGGFDRTYQCGCMILRNTSPKPLDVDLRATLGGQEVGTFKLFYRQGDSPGQTLAAFDWAGLTGDDVYVITAADVRPPGAAATAPTTPPSGTPTPEVPPSQRSTALRLQDYVTVVGQIDLVKCTELGAVFPVPGQLIAANRLAYVLGKPAGTNPFLVEPQVFQAECPFGPLNMRRAQYPDLPPPPAIYPTAPTVPTAPPPTQPSASPQAQPAPRAQGTQKP